MPGCCFAVIGSASEYMVTVSFGLLVRRLAAPPESALDQQLPVSGVLRPLAGVVGDGLLLRRLAAPPWHDNRVARAVVEAVGSSARACG